MLRGHRGHVLTERSISFQVPQPIYNQQQNATTPFLPLTPTPFRPFTPTNAPFTPAPEIQSITQTPFRPFTSTNPPFTPAPEIQSITLPPLNQQLTPLPPILPQQPINQVINQVLIQPQGQPLNEFLAQPQVENQQCYVRQCDQIITGRNLLYNRSSNSFTFDIS